jgi:hypothetical protein
MDSNIPTIKNNIGVYNEKGIKIKYSLCTGNIISSPILSKK